MITANELRIGNLVLKDGKPFRISGIEEGNRMDGFEGTPLTEEGLKKFGFKSANRRGPNLLYGGGLTLLASADGRFYLYWECSDPYYSEDGIKITTVHQLQNLYFALTREELTVKL